MSLLSLIVLIVVVVLVNAYIPMKEPIRNIFNIVVVVVIILLLLAAVGLLPELSTIRVGR